MNKIKFISLFSILLCLLLIVPAAFADDNQTDIPIADSFEDNDLGDGDYYFDANIENDAGNGSKENPYKKLTPDRIDDNNSIVHLSSGKYNLGGSVNCNNLKIIGQGSSKTTLSNGKITVSSSLTFIDISLKNVTIINKGKLTATNSIINYNAGSHILGKTEANNLTITGNGASDTFLKSGTVSASTSLSLKNIAVSSVPITTSGNITATNTVFDSSSSTTNGGAIYSSSEGVTISLNNCTFSNNRASYGGAIYMNGGALIIKNSLFKNNQATYYGGAVTAKNFASITVKKSRFINDFSLNDAGGAFYIVDSILTATNMEISSCNATFGGAIASLSSDLKLTNFTGNRNRAKYSGGAIYQMYGSCILAGSTFTSNSARDGGALFVDELSSFKPTNNKFTKNTASGTAGAVYSIISEDLAPVSVLKAKFNNTFSKNTAAVKNSVYECNLPSLEIGNNDYIMIRYKDSYDGKLPTKYDLRSLNQVTSVKNQGKGGNCWAFAALASLESCILKATGKAYDLSEGNMKNVMSLYSDYGWNMATNDGGYDKMAIGYLTSWLGPINETDDKYNGLSALSSVFDSFIHIQDVLYLKRTSYTDNDAIKRAIMDYGAVSTSVYWSSSYIKNTKNYYYDGDSSANHAVCIVGWDDNYSKYNFGKTPKGNGAWIIKNSWGTSSGDKGYFYVSYYDVKLAPINKPEATYVFVLNDTFRFDKSYQYDIQGKTDYFLNSSSSVWYKNSFKASSKEYLAAVSTYFEKETSWDLSIYVNKVLKLTQSGKSPASYSTIELDKLISLKAGDSFDIVFKITVDGNAGVPISEDISLNRMLYREGISYISYDGKKWVDLFELTWNFTSHKYYSQVACIKAFTVLNAVGTSINLKVTNTVNPVEITATVSNQYGGIVKSGKVTFTVDGKSYAVNVKDGLAKFNYLLSSSKSKVVNATFTAAGFKSSTSKTSVKAKPVSIEADDVVCYYGKTVKYSVTLLDSDSNPVKGKQLKFKVNNKEYVATTNKNGIASISLDLNVGTYKVVVSFNNTYSYSKYNATKSVSVKPTVILPSITKYTFNSKYPISLVDSKGNPLKNTEFDVVIGGLVDTVSTDSYGKLKYTIGLNPGTYNITISNPKTNETASQSIKVVERITKNTDLTMYFGAGSSYKVKVLDDNGNVKKNLKVEFSVNGKTYYRYTNENGYAYLKISLQPKTYKITATYNGFKVSNRITVKPTIITKNIAVKKGKTIKFTAKLLNSKGKIVKYKKLTFKFKGKTYKIKTNKYGKATLKITSKVTKKYKVGKYAINTSYGNAKISNKITIKK